MERVPIGTKVAPLGINRTNVADGVTCRAVLIDPDPQMKFLAWDDKMKRKVEVNQDLVIKYGLRPMTTFFYLIAKLNTDMSGAVHGTNFVIEYLQLSENLNNDLATAIAEMGNFTSFALTKVKKSAEGRDLSYIKVTPSNYKLDPELIEALDKVRSDKNAIDAMWQLVDRSTSITSQEYEKLRVAEIPQLEAPTKKLQGPELAPPKKELPPVAPSVNDFGPEFAAADPFDGM